jgi:4-hydroxy-2-oxoheptanedioate aldolase
VLTENTAKKLLVSGQPAVGIWLAIPGLTSAEALATIGWDWLTLDVEHAPFNLETQQALYLAIASQGCVPLARIAANDTTIIKQTLDAGAMGVVVPMVCSAAEAKHAVEACRYPLEGVRSAGGGRWRFAYGADWQQRANDETLCIVMIEHHTAVDRAEEILAVPGVDACFIGPNDLAASMGLGLGVPLESDDPRLTEAIAEIRNACVRNGVAPGIHCSGAAGVNQRIGEGFQFCALASELRYMLSGLRADLAQLNWTRAEMAEIGDGVAGAAVRY